MKSNLNLCILGTFILSLVSGDVGMDMVKLMNEARKASGLPEITYSSNLAKVAQTHSENMAQAKAAYPGIHDWYGELACKFDSNYNCMWDKPSKLTSYKGKGYEISVQGATTPQQMIEGWKGSSAHADVIYSRGMWASQPWLAVGGGYKDGYGTMWFGHEKDSNSQSSDGYPGDKKEPGTEGGDGAKEPGSQQPPQQGAERPQQPPQQGGDQSQQPPQQGGGQPMQPPQQEGGQPMQPPQQGGGQPMQPPQQGGGQPMQPPQQGGGRPQFPPQQGGNGRPQFPPQGGNRWPQFPPQGGSMWRPMQPSQDGNGWQQIPQQNGNGRPQFPPQGENGWQKIPQQNPQQGNGNGWQRPDMGFNFDNYIRP